MSSVTRLKQGMPSINGSLTDMLIGEQPLPPANVEPPKPPSIRERIKYSSIRLEMPDDMTDEEWLEVGQLIAAAESGIQWWIGDWINRFKEEWGWGEIYEKALALFPNYDDGSLANFASVAKAVHFSRRREKPLTYSHHVLVAGYTDQQQNEKLAYAAANNLSVRDFKVYLSGRVIEPPTPDKVQRKRQVDSKMKSFRAAALQAIVNDEDLNMDVYYAAVREIAALVGQMKHKARVFDKPYELPTEGSAE